MTEPIPDSSERDELDQALDKEDAHFEREGYTPVPQVIEDGVRRLPPIEIDADEDGDDEPSRPKNFIPEEIPEKKPEPVPPKPRERMPVPSFWRGKEETEEPKGEYKTNSGLNNSSDRKSRKVGRPELKAPPPDPISVTVYELAGKLQDDEALDDEERIKRLLEGTKLLRMAKQIVIGLTAKDTDANRALERLNDIESGGKLPQRPDDAKPDDEVGGVIFDI